MRLGALLLLAGGGAAGAQHDLWRQLIGDVPNIILAVSFSNWGALDEAAKDAVEAATDAAAGIIQQDVQITLVNIDRDRELITSLKQHSAYPEIEFLGAGTEAAVEHKDSLWMVPPRSTYFGGSTRVMYGETPLAFVGDVTDKRAVQDFVVRSSQPLLLRCPGEFGLEGCQKALEGALPPGGTGFMLELPQHEKPEEEYAALLEGYAQAASYFRLNERGREESLLKFAFLTHAAPPPSDTPPRAIASRTPRLSIQHPQEWRLLVDPNELPGESAAENRPLSDAMLQWMRDEALPLYFNLTAEFLRCPWLVADKPNDWLLLYLPEPAQAEAHRDGLVGAALSHRDVLTVAFTHDWRVVRQLAGTSTLSEQPPDSSEKLHAYLLRAGTLYLHVFDARETSTFTDALTDFIESVDGGNAEKKVLGKVDTDAMMAVRTPVREITADSWDRYVARADDSDGMLVILYKRRCKKSKALLRDFGAATRTLKNIGMDVPFYKVVARSFPQDIFPTNEVPAIYYKQNGVVSQLVLAGGVRTASGSTKGIDQLADRVSQLEAEVVRARVASERERASVLNESVSAGMAALDRRAELVEEVVASESADTGAQLMASVRALGQVSRNLTKRSLSDAYYRVLLTFSSVDRAARFTIDALNRRTSQLLGGLQNRLIKQAGQFSPSESTATADTCPA